MKGKRKMYFKSKMSYDMGYEWRDGKALMKLILGEFRKENFTSGSISVVLLYKDQ
jgi:hypothetical protein